MEKLKLEIDLYCEVFELPEQDGCDGFSSEEYNQDYY